ncbi:uncharacterized protein LOC130901126 [Diorhabda carinulata]|uniref:uncharacterized protein LOC130440609 n=1 Tax=Diorhabda sublineata TaxID=1163346 RepID=UPI0024E07529|nr:uncharacterized protein LOC130440609 [Diorhabda sublineata]XP_057668214.1 uncharacterized protein LOC130901126 [Diorhabda carinulata]
MSNTSSNIGSHSLVVKSLKVEEKQSPRFKCSHSENGLKISSKGIKQKIVNKVRSWSSRDKYSVDNNMKVETLLGKNQISEEDLESMENIADSNLTRARGSLENLLKDESEPVSDEWRCRSLSVASGSSPKNSPDSPKSTPDTSRNAKHLLWDPFDKKGRKNRKELGRKKKKNKNKVEVPKQECSSIPMEGKSCLSKPLEKEKEHETETVEEEYTYKYKYFPKNSKSVVFTNEVFVVYFNEQDVVSEAKEPLKKDIDQQERNKEMRHGHLLKTQEKYNLCLY